MKNRASFRSLRRLISFQPVNHPLVGLDVEAKAIAHTAEKLAITNCRNADGRQADAVSLRICLRPAEQAYPDLALGYDDRTTHVADIRDVSLIVKG